MSTLADEVRARPALPKWTSRYDDVLTPALRGDLAVWQAAVGVKSDDRALAGPPPTDDREAAYHRHLSRTVNAPKSEGAILATLEQMVGAQAAQAALVVVIRSGCVFKN